MNEKSCGYRRLENNISKCFHRPPQLMDLISLEII